MTEDLLCVWCLRTPGWCLKHDQDEEEKEEA